MSDENAVDKAGVVNVAGAAFLGMLIALILRGMMDGFTSGYVRDGNLHQMWKDLLDTAWQKFVLISCQVFVFLLTVIRFYMGNLRFHQETKQQSNRMQFLSGLFATIVLFSLFYLAAISIRTTDLFYDAMLGTQAVSMICSLLIASVSPDDEESLPCVWVWFFIFDLINTIALLAVVISHPVRHVYIAPAIALLVLTAVGFYDIYRFWPFYTAKDGWRREVYCN